MIDGGKHIFRLRLKLCSSLYPEDDHLQHFFLLVNENQFETPSFSSSVQGFNSMNPEVCIQYFPIIMKHLLLGISKNTKQNAPIGQTLLKALITLISK